MNIWSHCEQTEKGTCGYFLWRLGVLKRFRSSSQSGDENGKVSGFLIFVNTGVPLEAAAHQKVSKRPAIRCKAVLIAGLQMSLPECFPYRNLGGIKTVFYISVEEESYVKNFPLNKIITKCAG